MAQRLSGAKRLTHPAAVVRPSASSGARPMVVGRRGFLAGLTLMSAGCVNVVSPVSGAVDPSELEALLRSEMDKAQTPGLQYTIVKGERVIAEGALGLANIEHHVPAGMGTLFQINSITKAFTGVAVMQLVERGALDLDGPLSSQLGDLPPAWGEITLRRCLTHTSGLPQITDVNGDLLGPTFEEAWSLVLKAPMESPPGARFSYNQTNYVLAGRLIERAGQMPFTRFIARGQFEPAGMPLTARAGFVDAYDIVPDAARVYTFERKAGAKVLRSTTLGNNPFFEEFPPPLRTAAGLYSTSQEMARWLKALRSGQLLRPESLKTLWTPGRLNDGSEAGFSPLLNGYALGWPVIRRARHPAVGAVGGGRSAFFVYPEDDITVIVLTNLRGARPEAIVESVAARLWQ